MPTAQSTKVKATFDAWTPRLLKAAYNYQTSIKDPGAFAHGGKYIIELLYDSIEDLNTKLAEPVDMTALNRNRLRSLCRLGGSLPPLGRRR